MLQIQHIKKEYRTGSLVQKALDDVSLNLRDNEFVAILGPSGSGKTTLLNIIGGLDRYDSGDLIINGISTKKYKDRDWDSYRNHTIGFVFQSYNLIPHQTVLANVELALTISGVGKEERRKRAVDALEKVGLGQQLHKKPNQMSGGQMQRVAIARALVNDPEILLADEPTGALDSDTSVQVMDLLREVAKDRLVVMVTHNPELAEQYATRIVNLKDGKIRSDTDEYIVEEENLAPPEHKNMGKSSMSFLTALSLSFNNLRTKKARTLLTSFAGSIGIIGIALILALSNGVNAYIRSIEEETLSEYPLQIQSTGFDLTSMMVGMNGDPGSSDDKKSGKDKDKVKVMQVVTNMFSKMDSNDLGALKKYLDSGESKIHDYTKAIEYSYNVMPQLFRQDGDNVRQVNPDQSFSSLGLGASSGSNSLMSSMMSTNVFFEMPENTDLYEGQYDVKAGRWPKKYNECVLVLTPDGSMSDFLLYTLGLRDQVELDDMIKQFINEETIKTPKDIGSYTYDDILGKTFKLVNASDYYEYDDQYQVWKDKTDNADYMKKLVEDGENVKIVGIVQSAEDAKASSLTPGINYTADLVNHVAEQAKDSEIVKQQLANPNVNVFTGEEFGNTDGNNGFDMNSLFSIDEDALKNAFGFDSSAMNNLGSSLDLSGLDLSKAFQMDGNSMDLSGMVNLDQVEINMGNMPQMNLGDILANLDVQVNADGMQKYLKDIQKNNGEITITAEQIKELLTSVMSDFQSWLVEQNANPGAEEFGTYFQQYLQTGRANAIVNKWANEIFGNIDFNISSDTLQAMAKELADGYTAYAKEKNYADPTKMAENFVNYIKTDDGKRRLNQGLYEAINMDSLQKQISTAMISYMGQAMSAYTGAISQAISTQMTSAMSQVTTQLAGGLETVMTSAMSRIGENLQKALGGSMNFNADAFANAFRFNMTGDDLTELMMSMSGTQSASYDNNLQQLGYADFSQPSSISIYPKDFDNKEKVVEVLDHYNQKMEDEGKEEQVISYTDIVGTMMSSVTTIINTISYVLIAFVAISLLVSSIMIGVITYISVLERKKEIGILRAIGASKGNISQVFNAETFIIGLCAGLIGIGLTLLILIPGNMLIHALADNDRVSAVLPAAPAIVLILLSVVLTLLGGLIPSRKAAKSDPVTALRTE